MKGWIVAKTHSQRETWACENIARQGGTPYLPRISERVRIKSNSGAHYIYRARCLFPCYVFVRIDGAWRYLLGTFGVSGIITSGGGLPALLADKIIEEIKSREDDSGLVQLPELPRNRQQFRPGARVRISQGNWSGYTGIYDGTGPQERQRILLDFLGRKTTVLIGASFLEAA